MLTLWNTRILALARLVEAAGYVGKVRIPLDPGARSGVIRALVPVDLGAVGAKRRATSGSERSDG
jgi:hypothetical protein